jgi:glycosyltransferase involved in cell wall biosynthesis
MLPLARRHQITYLCRASGDSGAMDVAREFYEDRRIRFIAVGDPPTGHDGVRFYGRLAANLLSRLPYSIASHRSHAVRDEIRRIAATEKVDLWQFEALGYADALAGTAQRTIVVAHNVESLIWERLYETEKRRLRRWFIREQWRKYERYEREALRRASRVVAVSREDAALLARRFGVANAAVVDNGVDVAHFAAHARERRPDPKRILFLGSLDWRPNLDGIDTMLERVMPQVLAQVPDARLSIVGRNPPPALVRRIQRETNVELHADVADVRPFLANSAVMAVPLRIGGGSRLKILEAIAAGLPVVSTRVGSEGLLFEADRDLAVVDNEDHLAAALVDSIRDPDRAARQARSGRALIETHYDWSRLADRLELVWCDLVEGG